METRRRQLVAITAAAVLTWVVMTTGAARAQSAPTIIYACANKLTGLLRMATGPHQCTALEYAVQWTSSGPPGPPGPAGPQGPAGPMGPAGPGGTTTAYTVYRTPAEGQEELPRYGEPWRVVASLAVPVGSRWAITATVDVGTTDSSTDFSVRCSIDMGGIVGIDQRSIDTWILPPLSGYDEQTVTLHGATVVLPGTGGAPINYINVQCNGRAEWRSARITAVQVTNAQPLPGSN